MNTEDWEFDDLKKLRAQLKAGFKPDDPLGESFRPLIMAIENSMVKAAVAFIEAGADVNKVEEGITPLQRAAVYGQLDVVEALLKAGADPSFAAKPGRRSLMAAIKGGTALEMAVRAKEQKVVARLQSLGNGKASARPTKRSKLDEIRASAFQAIDFEGSAEPVHDGLAGKKAKTLSTIGKTGSDSVFAIWPSTKGNLDKAPVVYLDSEGEPRSVVARTLDEFLTILPFGTGFLYDVLTSSKKPPVATKALEAAAGAEDDVDGTPFLIWWKKTFGVAPAKEPAKVIAAARKACDDLEAWLSAKATAKK